MKIQLQEDEWITMNTVDKLNYLNFADSIHTYDQAQQKTNKVDNIPRSIDFRIHPGRSKVMKVTTDSTATIIIEGKS